MEESRREEMTMEESQNLDFNALMQEKAFQSEFDRRVSRALETARSKWAQETKQQVEQARSEAEALARMNSQERAAHEFAQRSARLDEREQAILGRELRAEASQQLQSRGLPTELVGIVNCSSPEGMQASLDTVEQAFRSAVQRGVEDRLRGSVPAGTRGHSRSLDSDEDYYRAHYAPGGNRRQGG